MGIKETFYRRHNDPKIDAIYEKAKSAGALGGKSRELVAAGSCSFSPNRTRDMQ